MTFTPIASSSHGNAYLVTDGESRILLECGIPFRRLQSALSYRVQELDGCLITHEHKDHAGHVAQLIKRGVPCFASPGTVEALGRDGITEGITPLLMLPGKSMGAPGKLAGFTVVPFRTFHDAAEPVGYLLRDSAGETLAFATDTVNLRYRFPGLTLLAIEANYEEALLARNTRIPEMVIRRIRNSHMEIGRLCEYLAGLDLSACREVYLLHLSDASSDEAYFRERVRRVVPPGCRVTVCPRGG